MACFDADFCELKWQVMLYTHTSHNTHPWEEQKHNNNDRNCHLHVRGRDIKIPKKRNQENNPMYYNEKQKNVYRFL